MGFFRSHIVLVGLLVLSIQSCMNIPSRPEVHGHRGARGLMPENTIPGFKKATRQALDWLEMDIVVSGDGKIVVSHEPWMNHILATTKDGKRLTPEEGKALNLYKMPYKEINDYDVGLLEHPDFPDQKQKSAPKPLLEDVIEEVEEHIVLYGLRMVGYNVEVKSRPEWYGIYQPEPIEYARILMDEIDALNIDERLIIQSFDPAILQAIHERDETVELALLVDNDEGIEANLKNLGFIPPHYSPHNRLVDSTLVAEVRARDMEIHVWTVNDEARMEELIALHVNGIITDYPDRLVDLLNKAWE